MKKDFLPHLTKLPNVIKQYGFTLIELMIALVLGLLISAAVIQVFLTSQRVDRVQTAASEIQDKAVFGLQSIEPQLRLANLGNDELAINDTTILGGVILTARDNASIPSNINATKNNGYLTRGQNMASTGGSFKWNGTLSNTDKPSDQLTIQYINITGRILFNCEGDEIAEGEHVITRFFIKESADTTKKGRKNLNLNCDAGRIKSDGTLEDFGDGGETIIENIDQFNIRLGVQYSDGASGYHYADMTVKDYMAITGEKPFITTLRLAILARSTANSPEDSADEFDIFGDEQTLKAKNGSPNYLRRVYESNTLLRNARIMHVVDSSSAP